MTETEVRAAIKAVIEQMVTDHSAYILVVEPQGWKLIDQTTQTNPYAKAWIEFLAADQADLGENPLTKQWGQVELQAVFKEGKGLSDGVTLRDFMKPYFHYRSIDRLHFQMAEIHKGAPIEGWEHLPLLINFFYFS